VKQGEEVGIAKRKAAQGDDVTGLQELIMYGLKGLAAYADHAQNPRQGKRRSLRVRA